MVGQLAMAFRKMGEKTALKLHYAEGKVRTSGACIPEVSRAKK